MEERAAGLALQIGQQSFSVRLDADVIDTIERAVHEATERAGRIDILVNNAAIFDMAPLLDVTPQGFERLFQVNVEGFFFVLQAVARLMVRDGRGGCIINMASQAGRRRGRLQKALRRPWRVRITASRISLKNSEISSVDHN